MRQTPLLSLPSVLAAAVVVTATIASPGTTVAQAPAGGSGSAGIAVVDVAYIFQNDTTIKAQVENVQKQFDAVETEIKARRDELKKNAEMLAEIEKDFKVGSPQYAAQEEKVASLESKLRLEMARKKKELQDAEAKIYYDNYKLIQEATKVVAQYNKIKVVLRYNSQEIEPENGQSILRGVSRNVVYHDPAIDLTKGVMTMMGRLIASKR